VLGKKKKEEQFGNESAKKLRICHEEAFRKFKTARIPATKKIKAREGKSRKSHKTRKGQGENADPEREGGRIWGSFVRRGQIVSSQKQAERKFD